MKEICKKSASEFQGLPDISLRQLDVFRKTFREKSYSHAALELRTTRANIKRLCEDFELALGHRLFDEDAARTLHPTDFAKGLLDQMTPLSRKLRRLSEGVRALHQAGRVVRFAAASEFFGGGLFTQFLSRLQMKDSYRPCFLKIEMKRFRTALLNTECEVYFGIGLMESDRLDIVDLGPVPWKITRGGETIALTGFSDLSEGGWKIARAGETGFADSMLEAFHAAGAADGELIDFQYDATSSDKDIIFRPDISGALNCDQGWPCYRFFAVLRKCHPYSDLKNRLAEAAL